MYKKRMITTNKKYIPLFTTPHMFNDIMHMTTMLRTLFRVQHLTTFDSNMNLIFVNTLVTAFIVAQSMRPHHFGTTCGVVASLFFQNLMYCISVLFESQVRLCWFLSWIMHGLVLHILCATERVYT